MQRISIILISLLWLNMCNEKQPKQVYDSSSYDRPYAEKCLDSLIYIEHTSQLGDSITLLEIELMLQEIDAQIASHEAQAQVVPEIADTMVNDDIIEVEPIRPRPQPARVNDVNIQRLPNEMACDPVPGSAGLKTRIDALLQTNRNIDISKVRLLEKKIRQTKRQQRITDKQIRQGATSKIKKKRLLEYEMCYMQEKIEELKQKIYAQDK